MTNAWRSRLGSLVTNFNETREYHGALPTLRASIESRFLRDRFRFHLFALDHPHVPPEDPRIAGRFATRSDLDRMISIGQQKADTLHMLELGDACLLQFIDGRLVGWAWMTTGPTVEVHPGLFLTIPSDAAYSHRTWTVPEARGLGLHARRSLEMFNECRRRGRRRLLCYVKSTNLASLSGVRKAGYRPVGMLRFTTREPIPGQVRLEVQSSDLAALSVRVEGSRLGS
jgi:GNAT superfamily N-acetyltransferase